MILQLTQKTTVFKTFCMSFLAPKMALLCITHSHYQNSQWGWLFMASNINACGYVLGRMGPWCLEEAAGANWWHEVFTWCSDNHFCRHLGRF